jgi:hypothetical protein
MRVTLLLLDEDVADREEHGAQRVQAGVYDWQISGGHIGFTCGLRSTSTAR